MYEIPIAFCTVLFASLPPVSMPIPAKAPAPTGIEWKHGPLAAALESSTQQSGLTLVYFWADGSTFSGKLYSETLSKPEAAEAVKGIVCYNAKHSTDTAKLFERYKVKTLPTMLFVRSNGEPEDVITGFIPVEDFQKEIARIKRAEGTRTGLAAALAKHDPASEDGIEARWLLVGKLQELGLTKEEADHTAKIKELDPEGHTKTGGQLKLNDMFQEVFDGLADVKPEQQEEALRKADFSPIYAFAKSAKNQAVRFNAWSSLARVEANRKNYSAAQSAIVKSIRDVADENRAGWCNAVAGWVVTNAEELSSKERKYGLSLAQKSVKLTQAIRKKAVGAAGRKVKIGAQDEKPEIDGFELSDDALAQRMCVLAQAEFMNRKRDKAKKTIADAAALAQDEGLKKEIARVAHKITSDH